MPLDPSAEMMIQVLSDMGMTFKPGVSPEERRASMIAATANPAFPKHQIHDVYDRALRTDAGSMPVRVYRPSSEDGLPLLLWFHGGGWVTGNLDTHDQLCRQLCDDANVVIVSVDYRLAPETKFPGAVEDCFAAYEWALRDAAEVGADPARVAIGGDSAGGNLAAVVALMARESGLPQPALQLLVYPDTDYEFATAAMNDNATGYFLEAEGMRWFWEHYSRTPDDYDDWRFSPLRAGSHDNLARAVVITAEYDPLRDQGEEYGKVLVNAGVECDVVRADGLIHGFFGMHAFMPPGQAAWDIAVDALRATLWDA
jgi:acetyl esterase